MLLKKSKYNIVALHAYIFNIIHMNILIKFFSLLNTKAFLHEALAALIFSKIKNENIKII
jgi:hypothetical protein